MSLTWNNYESAHSPDCESDCDPRQSVDIIVDNPTNELAYWECAMSEFMTEFGRRPVDGKEFSRVAMRAQAIKLSSIKLSTTVSTTGV